jgi:hypothetical protein
VACIPRILILTLKFQVYQSRKLLLSEQNTEGICTRSFVCVCVCVCFYNLSVMNICFLYTIINTLPSGNVERRDCCHVLLTGHVFLRFLTRCHTHAFVSWSDSLIASRLLTPWCRMFGSQVTNKQTGPDSLFLEP